MIKHSVITACFLLLSSGYSIGQDNLFARYTTKENRTKIYRNIVDNTINKNLSLPITDSTESNWTDAFDALELMLMRSEWIDQKIATAVSLMHQRSIPLQRALLELLYTNYRGIYLNETKALMKQTPDPKIFAMCAVYLFMDDSTSVALADEIVKTKFPDNIHTVINMLWEWNDSRNDTTAFINDPRFIQLFKKDFLPGQIVMYSFQRKDRNFPGLVVIRNADGKFISDQTGNIFYVPQLARSISNLPFFLTNGNTPQGLFKMHGFGVSTSTFIGPSPNIQMAMPVESSPRYFFADSSRQDSLWTPGMYAALLPPALRNYEPLFQTFYAGAAGRTEIISHGTTVDAELYKHQTYYPLTPTQGCLCTKEIWDGKRIESNQKKLIEAMLKAGGAEGYVVVVELDDKKEPVSINELVPFLIGAEK